MKTRKETSEKLRTALVIVLVLFCAQAFSTEDPVLRNEQILADSNIKVSYLTASVDFNRDNTIYSTQSQVDLNAYSAEAYGTVGYYEIMEEDIVMEEWMLTPKHSFWKDDALTEKEDEIALEPWMLDSSLW